MAEKKHGSYTNAPYGLGTYELTYSDIAADATGGTGGNISLDNFVFKGSDDWFYLGGAAHIKPSSYYGFGGAFKTLVLGATSGNSNVSIGYDPQTNTSGSFAGDGSETIFRNGQIFVTPNAANDGYHRNIMAFKDGKVGFGTSAPAGLVHAVSGSGFSAPPIVAGDGVGSLRVVFNTSAYAGVPANKPWLHSYEDIYIGSDGSIGIGIISGGVQVARFNGANLGIGTTAPTYKLVVSNNGNAGFEVNPTGTGGGIDVLTYDRVAGAFKPLHFFPSTFNVHAVFNPGADNSYNVGNASFRWATVFAATGTINTSDEREKKWLQTGLIADDKNKISSKIDFDAFYKAGLELRDEFGFYQWLDAVEEKGEEARIHYGIRAQRVFAILEKYGVDPARIAFCCYDKWDDEVEPIFETVKRNKKENIDNPDFDPDKKVSAKNKKSISVMVPVEEQVDTGETKIVLEAGDRYGLRIDMFNMFMLSVLNQVQKDLDDRLAKLENA